MLSIPLILITPPLLVMILFPLILHYNTFFWIISWVVSCLQNCLFPVHNWVITLQWYEILNMCLLNVSKTLGNQTFFAENRIWIYYRSRKNSCKLSKHFQTKFVDRWEKNSSEIILQILIISSCHGHAWLINAVLYVFIAQDYHPCKPNPLVTCRTGDSKYLILGQASNCCQSLKTPSPSTSTPASD